MPYALSLKQPWAELILQRRKTIETRTWNTSFRGEFFIHASRQVDAEACTHFNIDPATLVTGAIVGRATIVSAKRYDTKETFLKDADKHLASAFTKTKYGYLLTGVQRVKPTPCKGKLNFFKIPATLLK